MNKLDIIAALAAKENLTEKQATVIINLTFGGFTNALKEGGRIEIRGFGSYSVREYGAYTGRNPKTGAKTPVESKRLSFFKVGRELKKRVNKEDA
jgi:integration host factor subunit beta